LVKAIGGFQQGQQMVVYFRIVHTYIEASGETIHANWSCYANKLQYIPNGLNNANHYKFA
jgi:hypothetical protein